MLRKVETSVTIAWDDVNCIERNSNITGYVVHFSPPSMSGTDSVMVAGTGDAGGMVTIHGLDLSTQYSIQVAAVNSDGDVGVLSTALSVQTASVTSKSGSAIFSFYSNEMSSILNFVAYILVNLNPNHYFHNQVWDAISVQMLACVLLLCYGCVGQFYTKCIFHDCMQHEHCVYKFCYFYHLATHKACDQLILSLLYVSKSVCLFVHPLLSHVQ